VKAHNHHHPSDMVKSSRYLTQVRIYAITYIEKLTRTTVSSTSLVIFVKELFVSYTILNHD